MPSDSRVCIVDGAPRPGGIRLAAAGCAVGVILYLGLCPSSHFVDLSWMPRWLAEWADQNGVLRNLPAFAGLAAFVLLVLAPSLTLTAGIAAFAVALEVAQLWLPRRHFDPRDIAVSLAGVALGWLIVCAMRAMAANRQWLAARPLYPALGARVGSAHPAKL